jgi:hypothetical protein
MVKKSQIIIFSLFEKNVELNFATNKSLVLIETCLEIQTLITCLFLFKSQIKQIKHRFKKFTKILEEIST